MKKKHFLKRILYIFLLLSTSCTNDITSESKIVSTHQDTISISGEIDNFFQMDSIISNITPIILETSPQCLIQKVSKIKFYKKKIFIQDFKDNLFVFDLSGHFLKQIGKKGKGPGEYLSLRDFDIDSAGNIFILDFLKIIKFDTDGNFVKKYRFKFAPEDKITCNPLQFTVKEDQGFFIWGGTFSIKQNTNHRLFAMYDMTPKGRLIERYFPIRYKLVDDFGRFKRYRESVLIDPVFGDNNVYMITGDSIEKKYYINFGKKDFDIPIPSNLRSLSEFKKEIDESYYHSVANFVEVDDWIFFIFRHKRLFYNVYYNKILKKSYVSKAFPRIEGRLMPWTIHGSYENKLVSVIESHIISSDIKRIDEKGLKIKHPYELSLIDTLRGIPITSNPIILISSMK